MKWHELAARRSEIGFVPQAQTAWLDPGRLGSIGVKVALAGAFADFDDKRELQQVLPSRGLVAPERDGDFWFDFTADTGDGFDAACTVMHYLARPWPVGHRAGELPAALPPGRLLLLGGDEVYPTASAEAYENRLKGPMQAAFPPERDPHPPWLVALPGNHDWYDGLTSFLRQFAQQSSIGRLRTVQDRSYFVLQLPRGWWIAGVDTQLGSYLDRPQLDFFDEHLSSRLRPGDAVIMSVPTPTWVHTADPYDPEPDAFNTMHWFERRYVRARPGGAEPGPDRSGLPRVPTGATVRMWITGDSHHYVRYEEAVAPAADQDGGAGHDAGPRGRATSRRQLVTCGLGGAYLDATHRLPPEIALPPPGSSMSSKDTEAVTFAEQTCYPSVEESRRLARRIMLPWTSGWVLWRNARLACVALPVQALLIWLQLVIAGLVHWSSLHPVAGERRTSLAEAVRDATGTDWRNVLVVNVVVVGGLALGAYLLDVLRRRHARLYGFWVVAIGSQVAVSLLVAFGAAWGWWGRLADPGFWITLLIAGCAIFVGALVGVEAFAVSVGTTNHKPIRDWQMAGQSIEDRKGFIRMVIRADGSLTMYPFKIDRVCHDWRLEETTVPLPDGDGENDERTYLRPVPAAPLPSPDLIEPPVTLDPPESWRDRQSAASP